MTRAVTDTFAQPFGMTDKVIVEKRDSKGVLDFSPPQPPLSINNKCPCCEGMHFEDVYTMFFRENDVPSAGWSDLKSWLDEKGWSVRARTW